MLFVIFINDIPEVTDGTSPALFADDTKVYKDVRSVTNCEKLQQTLDKLNIYKDPIAYPYHLDRNDLSRVENETLCKTTTFQSSYFNR